jgi:hypothetical protein
MSAEIPLEQNIFTGEWTDTRSRTQRQRDLLPPTQSPLQQETPQEMAFDTPLPSISHQKSKPSIIDQQTFDQPTQDELYSVEAPVSLFIVDAADVYEDELANVSGMEASQHLNAFQHDVQVETTQRPLSKATKLDLYLELVQLCEEEAETLWIVPLYAGLYVSQITATALQAQAAGLTHEEIQAAIHIGRFRGSTRKRQYLASKSK